MRDEAWLRAGGIVRVVYSRRKHAALFMDLNFDDGFVR
jgi:hypothetical protein